MPALRQKSWAKTKMTVSSTWLQSKSFLL